MEKMANLEAPLQIKGIQMELGIKNIGGQLELYHKLLHTFYKEVNGWVHELKFLWLKDKELFRIKVHGLKGSASYIAAYELFDSSSNMEAAAKRLDSDYVERHLDRYIDQIILQLINIKAYLDTLAENKDPIVFSESTVSRILAQKLKDAIDELDLDESWKYILEIRKRHGSAATKEILIKLNRLLDNLDYEEAINIIDENWLK